MRIWLPFVFSSRNREETLVSRVKLLCLEHHVKGNQAYRMETQKETVLLLKALKKT